MELLLELEKIIFNLKEENFDFTVDQTMKLFDTNHPYSFNSILSNLIYFVFFSHKDVNNIYFKYLEIIQTKEEEINKNIQKIIEIFTNNLVDNNSQESFYIIEKMLEINLIDKDVTKKIDFPYFAHYQTEEENKSKYHKNQFVDTFRENYKKLSKNNWELHKQLIEEGHNPNELAKIIRNDEIEKLQEISSQHNFDFNQTIKPSLYERCSFINQENVTLIYYAAFFSSVKCFKYLLMNGSNVKNTGKYAVAGGNEEIIHLCEQNHSSFKESYETAIEFHRNDIFKYLYENKIEELSTNLECFCIEKGNYKILLLLEENIVENKNPIINESARNGNLYLVEYYAQKNQIPKNILVFSAKSKNYELIKLLLGQKCFDINAKDIYMLYLIFILII